MKRYIPVSILKDKAIEVRQEFDTLKAKYQVVTDRSLGDSLYYQLNYLKSQIDVLESILMNSRNSIIEL